MIKRLQLEPSLCRLVLNVRSPSELQSRVWFAMTVTNSARTLGIYCAVEPDSQDETVSGSIVLSHGARLRRNFLIGRVLSVGKDVRDAVSVGQRVIYERESAHPSQTGPIDAQLFGGSEGKFAVVLPLYSSALKSVSELEEELIKRQDDVQRLMIKGDQVGLSEEDIAALEIHEKRVRALDEMRTGRARGQTKRKIADNAKGSGIVAVLTEMEAK